MTSHILPLMIIRPSLRRTYLILRSSCWAHLEDEEFRLEHVDGFEQWTLRYINHHVR